MLFETAKSLIVIVPVLKVVEPVYQISYKVEAVVLTAKEAVYIPVATREPVTAVLVFPVVGSTTVRGVPELPVLPYIDTFNLFVPPPSEPSLGISFNCPRILLYKDTTLTLSAAGAS